MERFFDRFGDTLAGHVPSVLGGLLVLLVGWILARLVAGGVRRGLQKTNWDDRLGKWMSPSTEQRVDWAGGVSQVVFYLLMILVLVGSLEIMGLTLVTEPMNRILDRVVLFGTNLIAAAALCLLAWVVAVALRTLIRTVLERTRFDERLGQRVDEDRVPVSRSISEAAYWLTFLFFAPTVLEALGLHGLLVPVQDLTNKVLSYLPQVAGAILVFLIGWFVARVIQRVVTSVLSASGLDRVGEKIGLGTALGNRTLSGVVGAVVYALILIPVLIAALDALALDAVTEPASAMLGRLLDAIPMIFAAAVLLIVSYFIARLVGSLVSNLLVGIGFDTVLSKLGLGTRTHTPGRRTPSEIVGFVVVVAVLLFASAEAAAMLEFDTLSMLISELTMFGGQVVFGIVIFSLGLLLANLVASTVRSSGVRQANLLAILSRVAILAVIGAMAIRHIVPESEIVDLAFSLTLGAFAVAAAIAFGWGGRDVARQLVTEWTAKLREPDVTER
ncbi:MAG: mechanosensitive ion channel [Candidatus Eisenbacteria bacterium]|uniref:Mechanosensitive ion channel n=1 Tax=Eiseniibacteriota bacterium TaxID=2212470 RepID=A0A956SDG1_UNCEI|nr:mechanosensitive ion channel [Candidatus Eisenbacteria bacterium]MCB9464623.1 mechanosensitive ion channel [Candidatus Eisenbacteria bacterium]